MAPRRRKGPAEGGGELHAASGTPTSSCPGGTRDLPSSVLPRHPARGGGPGAAPLAFGKVVETLIAQDEAGWAAALKQRNPNWTEEQIQEAMARRKRDGNCLFVFAMVCKPWREAEQKIGGRLRTRVESDVVQPGSVALAKWALAEGCPRLLMIS